MKSFVYVMRCGEYAKLGHAVNPRRRLSHIDHANPVGVEIEHLVECDASIASLVEAMAQDALAEFHCKGEWFKVRPEQATGAIKAALEVAASEVASGVRKVRKIYLSQLRKTQLREIGDRSPRKGAPSVLTDEQRAAALALWGDASVTAGEIARRVGANLRTLYNQLGPRRNVNAKILPRIYIPEEKPLLISEEQARLMWFDRVRYPSPKAIAEQAGVTERTLYTRFGPRSGQKRRRRK